MGVQKVEVGRRDEVARLVSWLHMCHLPRDETRKEGMKALRGLIRDDNDCSLGGQSGLANPRPGTRLSAW